MSQYAFQSPPQKQDYKSIGASGNLKAMQTTAGTKGFEQRETINSVQSSMSQPLKYSSSQFQHSAGRDGGYSQFVQTKTVGSANRQSLGSSVVQQDNSRSGEDVRDRIISMYKEEIRVQAARERDFEHLTALIEDLERRTQILESSLRESQKDHEEKLIQQNKLISNHQQDIESLKRNVYEKQQEGIKIYDEIQQTKSAIAHKEDEIFQNSKDLDHNKKYSEQLRKEIDYLQQDIFGEQDVKKKQQGVMYQLKNEIRYKEKENEDQTLKFCSLEKESKTLIERTQFLNQQLDTKGYNVEKVNQKLDQINRETAVLQTSINALDVDIVEAERTNDRTLEMQKKLLRTKEQEQLRGQDLTYNLKENENRLRDSEKQVENLKKDLEGVRYSNDAMLDRNQELKAELESLNQHADLLQSQNRELQRELDGFVETDEVVRRNLDRKDKVYQIRNKVDEVIQKSMYDLAQKSPQRKQRQSPEKSYRQEGRTSLVPAQQTRQAFFNESMNSRGSPLRRGHLDH